MVRCSSGRRRGFVVLRARQPGAERLVGGGRTGQGRLDAVLAQVALDVVERIDRVAQAPFAQLAPCPIGEQPGLFAHQTGAGSIGLGPGLSDLVDGPA